MSDAGPAGSRMKELKSFTRFEPLLLAALPLLGVALVVLHQMGRYTFYSVPFEFVEIGTVKTLLSALAIVPFCLAATYSLSLFFDGKESNHPVAHFLAHLGAWLFLSSMYWLEDFDFSAPISYSTVAFVLLASAITFYTDRHIRKSIAKQEPANRTWIEIIGTNAGVLFWLVMLVIVATVLHGALSERDHKVRTFIEGTNYLLVGRSEGQLILKEYDPTTQKLVRGTTILKEPAGTIVLVERLAEIH